MSVTVRRTIPLAIVSFALGVYLAEWALPKGPLTNVTSELSVWMSVVSIFTTFVATTTLVAYYARNLNPKKGWDFVWSIQFFAFFILYIVVATVTGGTTSAIYSYLYTGINGNIGQGKWIMFCFLEPWAAYVAFRVRSLETIVLALTGFLYLLYLAPTIPAAIPSLGPIAEWIIGVPSVAGARAGTITMGIGAAIMALRYLFGREKGLVE